MDGSSHQEGFLNEHIKDFNNIGKLKLIISTEFYTQETDTAHSFQAHMEHSQKLPTYLAAWGQSVKSSPQNRCHTDHVT